ncbi:MAG TPA: hypothetical protein VGG62_16635 [Terracidiphilus sp.]
MKRWHYFALAAVVVVGSLAYTRRDIVARLWQRGTASDSDAGRSLRGRWRTVDRAGDGFKINLPGDPKDLQVPAYNESGGSEPVHMLMAAPNADSTFAITWQDNPPVMRISSHEPERTLNAARDGMLVRTQTMMVSQLLSNQHGNPTMDVLARNVQGGILNARLVCAGNRLYIMMALFNSADAAQDQDVSRFFDSFSPSVSSAIPETMPFASHPDAKGRPNRTVLQR